MKSFGARLLLDSQTRIPTKTGEGSSNNDRDPNGGRPVRRRFFEAKLPMGNFYLALPLHRRVVAFCNPQCCVASLTRHESTRIEIFSPTTDQLRSILSLGLGRYFACPFLLKIATKQRRTRGFKNAPSDLFKPMVESPLPN